MKDVTIRLSGSITIGEGDVILHDKIHDALEQKYDIIVLDFHQVNYMDSSALGELMACQVAAGKHGVHLALVGIRPKIKKLLEVMYFLGSFQIFDTVEDALQILRNRVRAA